MTAADDAVFDALRLHTAPGTALGAKLMGRGAVEVEAQGVIVRLSDGSELIDFGSYAVTLLGHRPPSVVAAVQRQLETMPTATRVLANPVVAGLTSDLVERFGPQLDHVWLGSDGSDAVEVALKLARWRTSRPRVLAVERGFHGKTLGALALTWNPAFRDGLESVIAPATHLDPADPDAVGREAAAGDVAALVFEPVHGEGGAVPLDPAVLRTWANDARAAGAVVVSDEIQAGLRRCGPLSPSLAAGIEPDAILLGKALGGGVMPLSALLATGDLFEPLVADPTRHTVTFGGHPLSCAAGRAALREIEALAPAAARVSERVEDGLRRLARAHEDVVAAVHGSGLLWGVEMRAPGLAGTVLLELTDRGVLLSPCLSAPRTIRLLPPMVAEDGHVELVLAALDEALTEAACTAGDGEATTGASPAPSSPLTP